jgi:hypothetical protein
MYKPQGNIQISHILPSPGEAPSVTAKNIVDTC